MRNPLLVDDPDFRLYVGDVLEVLAELPDESVHCVVTSPPYWGLRDYGTGAWEGGDPDCDHLLPPGGGTKASGLANYPNGLNQDTIDAKVEQRRQQARDVCGKCGATRTDQQLGLEATPDLFVAAMVDVFREVRRVLRPDGVLWLNLGDSYASTPPGCGAEGVSRSSGLHGVNGVSEKYRDTLRRGHGTKRNTIVGGLKPKDLVGIPWRVAFALQADGWWLRSDVIWHKPNPMPESVTDRPTKAHEYVFLLTKSPRYFFDAEAVREPHKDFERGANGRRVGSVDERPEAGVRSGTMNNIDRGGAKREYNPAGRNIRSVWEIATQPYPEAHFATFPEALPERCIRAGTSERGCCPECGAPWVRETELTPEYAAGVEYAKATRRSGNRAENADEFTNVNHGSLGPGAPRSKQTVTTGWRPSCDCTGADDVYHPNVKPCTVLDPFMGSGTTALVARKLGRRSIGIELNPDYAALCSRRLQQLSLFAGEPA